MAKSDAGVIVVVTGRRIAHITATFWPHNTGTGIVAYYNALELVRQGHEVHLFTAQTEGAPAQEVHDGIQVQRLKPLWQYGNAPLLPALYKAARHMDLIHLHIPFYGGAEAIYTLCRRRGIPLVLTYHQDVELPGLMGWISRTHDRWVGQGLMKLAARTAFTSLDYARHSRFAPLLKGNQIRPVALPNGVDPDRFHPADVPASLRQKWALAKGDFVVLFVGVLDRAHYFKGVDILLAAMARLPAPKARLIVVGKGNMLTHYQQRVTELGLNERVHFAGFVPDAELPDYYRLADVTVLPSTTAGEAFGLVLLESLASETPVIAANLPGVRTVVAADKDGFMVEPGNEADLADRLAQMLSLTATERQAMGQVGRQKVLEKYAWIRIGDQLANLYQEIWRPGATAGHRE